MNHRRRIQNRRLRPNSGNPLEHNEAARQRRSWRRTERSVRLLVESFRQLGRAAQGATVSLDKFRSAYVEGMASATPSVGQHP